MCVFLAAVKSDYQGRISEGIHQAFVAAENLRMFLVCFGCCLLLCISSYTYLYFTYTHDISVVGLKVNFGSWLSLVFLHSRLVLTDLSFLLGQAETFCADVIKACISVALSVTVCAHNLNFEAVCPDFLSVVKAV